MSVASIRRAPRLMRLLIALLAVQFAAAQSRAAAQPQAAVPCTGLVVAAGFVYTFSVVYRLDCPGSQPQTIVFSVAGPVALNAAQVAAFVAASVNASPANVGCAANPGLNATVVNDAFGNPTIVNFRAVENNVNIFAFQFGGKNTAVQKVAAIGGAQKSTAAVSGTAQGGQVKGRRNPEVIVNTTPGESAEQVLLDVAAAFTAAGVSNTVVTLSGSSFLRPEQIVNATHVIEFPTALVALDGCVIESDDPGLTGFGQVDLLIVTPVPATPPWALVGLGLLIMVGGVVVILRRAPAA